MNSNAIGIDGLRLWVAINASENESHARIGPNAIQQLESQLATIRRILRFFLGCLHGSDLIEADNVKKLRILDKVFIFLFYKYISQRLINFI